MAGTLGTHLAGQFQPLCEAVRLPGTVRPHLPALHDLLEPVRDVTAAT
nr:hypothetical protein GCM10010200_098010 [Actinomadura rugatobispora]